MKLFEFDCGIAGDLPKYDPARHRFNNGANKLAMLYDCVVAVEEELKKNPDFSLTFGE